MTVSQIEAIFCFPKPLTFNHFHFKLPKPSWTGCGTQDGKIMSCKTPGIFWIQLVCRSRLGRGVAINSVQKWAFIFLSVAVILTYHSSHQGWIWGCSSSGWSSWEQFSSSLPWVSPRSAAPGPAEPTLPWTAVNFWLRLLALQGLQPSVTREWSNPAWQPGPREGKLKMSFLSFFAFLSCPACPATAWRNDYGPCCWTKSWMWHVSKSQDSPQLQFSVCRFDFWGWFPRNNFQLHSIIFSQKYFLFSKAVKQDILIGITAWMFSHRSG